MMGARVLISIPADAIHLFEVDEADRIAR